MIEHATSIVAAYLGHHSVAPDEIPAIIASVHMALSSIGQPTAPVEPARKPAVAIRKSVQPDAITCLDCGYFGQMLKRHLTTAHGLTPEQYRERWGLPIDYPVVAPNYAERRSALAKEIGLGTAHRGSAALGTGTRQRARR